MRSHSCCRGALRHNSDPALPRHNVSNTLGRNADFFCQAILAYAHGFKELLKEEFTRGDGLEFPHMYLS
jgi:hypothetical protein